MKRFFIAVLLVFFNVLYALNLFLEKNRNIRRGKISTAYPESANLYQTHKVITFRDNRPGSLHAVDFEVKDSTCNSFAIQPIQARSISFMNGSILCREFGKGMMFWIDCE